MQQTFEVVGKCWLLKSHWWLLHTQSSFLLSDWIASVQNQVVWSMETWTSPSNTFWKLQGTSWLFCFCRKLPLLSFQQHYLFPLLHTPPTRALGHVGEASSQGQTRGTAQASTVSGWHLCRWPPGRVPKVRQYLMPFYLQFLFCCIFSLYYMHIWQNYKTLCFKSLIYW